MLAGVSACVPVGSLCALLGPSGCGKSSLFDVLCGVADMTRVHGRVTSQVRAARSEKPGGGRVPSAERERSSPPPLPED